MTVYIVRKDIREGGENVCVTTSRLRSRIVACDKFLEWNKPRYDEEHEAYLKHKAECEADGVDVSDWGDHDPATKFAMQYPTIEAWHEARAKLGDEKFWDETGAAGYFDICVIIEEHTLENS
jgi:hypothetical protein